MSSFRPLVTALLGRFFSVVALMADGSFMVDILMASVFLDPEIACAPPAVSRASRTPAAPAIPGGPGPRLMVLVPAMREWAWCAWLAPSAAARRRYAPSQLNCGSATDRSRWLIETNGTHP